MGSTHNFVTELPIVSELINITDSWKKIIYNSRPFASVESDLNALPHQSYLIKKIQSHQKIAQNFRTTTSSSQKLCPTNGRILFQTHLNSHLLCHIIRLNRPPGFVHCRWPLSPVPRAANDAVTTSDPPPLFLRTTAVDLFIGRSRAALSDGRKLWETISHLLIMQLWQQCEFSAKEVHFWQFSSKVSSIWSETSQS